MWRGPGIGVTFRGRCSIWWASSLTFRGRRSTWWSSSVTFRGRCSIWWGSSVTFRGRRSTSWGSRVTFRGRRSICWMLESKLGRETLHFSIENVRGELEKSPRLRGGLRTDGFILGSFADHARIMLGSFSDHGRICPALEMTFEPFSEIFSDMLQCFFLWQAQYLVRLDGDTCCSAHCKWGFICDEEQE